MAAGWRSNGCTPFRAESPSMIKMDESGCVKGLCYLSPISPGQLRGAGEGSDHPAVPPRGSPGEIVRQTTVARFHSSLLPVDAKEGFLRVKRENLPGTLISPTATRFAPLPAPAARRRHRSPIAARPKVVPIATVELRAGCHASNTRLEPCSPRSWSGSADRPG